MIYAWILLGVLASGLALLIFMGIRSRNDGYIGMPPADKSNQVKPAYPSKNIDSQLDTKTSIDEDDESYDHAAALVMKTSPNDSHNDEPINGTLEIESDYEEALIMLREVKAMLLQGRADRAIEYIRQSSGVDHVEAELFVRDIENGNIG